MFTPLSRAALEKKSARGITGGGRGGKKALIVFHSTLVESTHIHSSSHSIKRNRRINV